MFPEKMPDYIIFDWDGTIVDTVPLIKKVHSDVFKMMGHNEWSEEDAQNYMRFSARQLYPDIFGTDAQKAFDYLDEFLGNKHIELLKVFDGAIDVVNMFNGMGISMSVISNKKHDYLIKEVNKLELNKIFDVVMGSGFLDFDKPDSRIKNYMFENVCVANNILVIGDTDSDLTLAKNCGYSFMPIGKGIWMDKYRSNAEDKPLCFSGFNNFNELKKYLSAIIA